MTTRAKKTAEESVNQVNNTTKQEAKQEAKQPEMIGAFGEDYTASVKIAKVIAGSYDNRVAFVTEGTPLAGFNESNEEAAVTTFGLNVNELCNQVRQQVPELAMFETAAMGKRINPQVVAFIFQGAEMQIERVYKEKGEQREATNDVYSANCFVTKIKKVTTHINQMAQALLQQLLMQSVQQSMQPVTANPFNVR
jgi:hypothetical protein